MAMTCYVFNSITQDVDIFISTMFCFVAKLAVNCPWQGDGL